MADRTVIVGGGHVGLTLYADIRRARPTAHVRVLSSKVPDVAGTHLTMHDTLTGEIHSVPTERADFLLPVTVEPAALTGADCVFVTVPDIPSVRSAVVSRLLECLAHRSVSVVMIRGGQGVRCGLLNVWPIRGLPHGRCFSLRIRSTDAGCRAAMLSTSARIRSVWPTTGRTRRSRSRRSHAH